MNAINRLFKVKTDFALIILALNLLNLVAWSLGFFIHPFLYLTALIAGLIAARPFSYSFVVCLLVSIVCCLLVLGYPVSDWDARSIWFFHAKRIFYNNNLYAQLDNYGSFSHNYYPVLVPALAASIARGVGYWNEIFPRISVVFVILPPLLVLARLVSNKSFFNLLLAGLLLSSRSILINGYMDGILAIYFAASCAMLMHMYSDERAKQGSNNITQDEIVLALMSASMLLLKNEGSLAVLLVWVCLLPLNYRRWRGIILSCLPFLFFFLIWKLQVLKFNVGNDLMSSGLFTRFSTRIKNIPELTLIGKSALKQTWIYLLIMFCALAFFYRFSMPKKLLVISCLPLAYAASVSMAYVITPNDLNWHLATSADRVYLVFNLSVLSVCGYMLSFARDSRSNQLDLQGSL